MRQWNHIWQLLDLQKYNRYGHEGAVENSLTSSNYASTMGVIYWKIVYYQKVYFVPCTNISYVFDIRKGDTRENSNVLLIIELDASHDLM